jgi:hypothetical protein
MEPPIRVIFKGGPYDDQETAVVWLSMWLVPEPASGHIYRRTSQTQGGRRVYAYAYTAAVELRS